MEQFGSVRTLFEINLDVAEGSRCDGSLKGLEAVLCHRVFPDIEYLSSAGLDP